MNERIRVSTGSGSRILQAIAQRWAAIAQDCLPATCIVCGTDEPSALCSTCEHALKGQTAPRCARCGSVRTAGDEATGQAVCHTCRLAPPAFARSVILADYAPPLDRIVQALKFGHDISLAAPLGRALGRRVEPVVAELAGDPSCRLVVTAIPLAAPRLAGRGFNQSLLLARAMVASMRPSGRHALRSAALRLDHRLLVRQRDTAPASTLHASERRRALQDSFAARQRLDGWTVLVVDDVMTTGATLESAARTLIRAGARSVINCVIARTPARPA